MSPLLIRIKNLLKESMTNEVRLNKDKITGDLLIKEQDIKSACRSIISMYPSINVKPEKATDLDTIKLIRQFIKDEKTRLLYQDKHLTEKDVKGLNPKELSELTKKKISELNNVLTSTKIKIAESLLPKEVTDEEVIIWIKDNLDDLSKLKIPERMKHMKKIMENFSGRIDGSRIAKLITEL